MPQLGPILPTPDVIASLHLPTGPDYTQPEWQQGLLDLREAVPARQAAYQKALTALHVTLNDVDPVMAASHQRRFLQESGGDVSKAQAAAASQGYRFSPESWNPVVTQRHEEAGRQQIQADPTNAANAPTGWGQNFLANVLAAHQSGVTANQVALMHGLSAIQPLKPGETPEQHHAKLWQGTQGFLEQQADAERMNNPHNPEGFMATAGQVLGSLPTGISPLTYIGGGYGQGAAEVASNPEMTPEQKTKYASAGALINAAQLVAFGPAFEAAGAAAPTEAGVLNAASRVGAKSVAGGTVFAGGSVAKDALMGKPLDAGEAAKAYLTGSTLAGGHEVVAGGPTPTPTETPGEIGPQRPWQTPEELAGQPKAEAPKPKPAPELRKSIQKLGERLDAVDYNKIPEATPGEHAPLPEELTNEDLHTFLTPQEEGGPASFRGGLRVKEAAERLAAHEHQPDRTGTQGPPGDEERRFDELAKGATFQSPEEANPRGIAAMNAYKPEVGTPTPESRLPFNYPYETPEENPYNPRQAYKEMSQADRLAARVNEPLPETEKPNVLQQAAGNQAVREEYGATPTPAPAPEAKPVEQPNALAAAREAQVQTETPKAAAEATPAPEGETLFQRIAREGAEKIKALAGEEHGGSKVAQTFMEQSVKPTAEVAKESISDAWRGLRQMLGHQTGEAADKSKDALKYMYAERQQRADIVNDKLVSSERNTDKLTPAEQRKMTYDYEAGRPVDPRFAKEVDVTRDLLDERLAQIQKRDPNFQGLPDYLGHMYKDPVKASNILAEYMARKPLAGNKNYAKHRLFPTQEEANLAGLENVSDNLFTTQKMKLAAMDKWITAFDARQKMDDAHLLSNEPKNGRIPEGMSRIDDPMFRGKIADSEVASVLNNSLSRGITGDPNFGGIIRGVRTVGNTLNQANLSVSMLHALTSTGNSALSEFSRGLKDLAPLVGFEGKAHPVSGVLKLAHATTAVGPAIHDYLGGGDFQEEWVHPGSTTPEMATIVEAAKHDGGRAFVTKDYQTEATTKMLHAFRQGNVIAGTFRAPFALIDQLAKPIMEKMVPKLKAAAYVNMARDVMRDNPGLSPKELSKKVGQGWRSVDNRFGEMVYDNKFWNATVKQTAQMSMRSLGWNYGTENELVGAGHDTAKALASGATDPEKSPEFTHRMAYAVALPTLVGIWGAMANYAYTGHGPKTLFDAYAIPTGDKDKQGKDIRVMPPTYMKDVLSFTHDPESTVEHKLHPLISNTMEFLKNKDYYGDKIYQEDDKGFQIAKDLAGHGLKDFGPLSLSQFLNNSESPLYKRIPQALSGLNTAAKWMSTSDAEQEAYKPIEVANANKPGRTTQAKTVHDLTGMLRTGKPDAQEQIKQAVTDGTITPKDAMAIRRNAQRPAGLKGAIENKELSADYLMKKVFPKMTPEEVSDNQLVIRRKLAGADLPIAEKQQYLKQLNDAVGGKK